MPAVSTALRRFITGVTRIFHGARFTFLVAVAKWRSAVTTLGKQARSLANKFASLRTTKRVASNGEELVMLGRVEGREFATMLRTARSIPAFEAAAETALSPAARAAFRHLDDVATLHFPDVSVMRRNEYLSRSRDALIANGAIGRTERVTDALRLELLIRSDATTLKRTNSLMRKLTRTKTLVYLGGAITITGVGLAHLSRTLVEFAARNSGCFVYTRDLANNVRKCRVDGCSCPTILVSDTTRACDEANMWERMRLRSNECAAGTDRPAPYCVHCDWNETDPTSLDFVDKERLPSNAYVACESMDALDALHEVVAGTLEDVYDFGSKLTNVVKDGLASSANVLPWIIGGAVMLVLCFALFYVWRAFGGERNHSSGETSRRVSF